VLPVEVLLENSANFGRMKALINNPKFLATKKIALQPDHTHSREGIRSGSIEIEQSNPSVHPTSRGRASAEARR
jgi:hypothetical protein